MNTGEPYNTYDDFAWFYDRYWGKWSELAMPIFEKIFLPHVPVGGLILDLCCGQGHMASALVKMGYSVIGIDGSQKMLSYARLNAPDVNFIHADARSFSVPGLCDAAISTYDSLNHIMTREELESAFGCVRKALKPGGPFVFDLNIEEGFAANWKSSFGRVGEDNAIIACGSYDPEKKRAELALTMFRLQDGKWRRSDLTIPERCYSEEETVGAVQRAGFELIASYNSGRDLGFKAAGRQVYLARAV